MAMQLKQANCGSSEFSQAMDIYSASFPKNETRPVRDTIQMIGDHYKLMTISEDGKCLGFALVYVFDRFALLDYMEVKSGVRGKGIGTKLLDELKRTVLTKACKAILLEVQHADASDMAPARLKFYKKNDAVLVSDRYIMPGYSAGEHEEMNLMAIFPENCQTVFTENQLETMIRQIYSHVYNASREDLMDMMMKNYRDLAIRQ